MDVCVLLSSWHFLCTHMNSITSFLLTDTHSMVSRQEATFICILSIPLNKIHISHYWYHHVFHSPGLSPSIILCQFHPHCVSSSTSFSCLVLVILPLLLRSCLYFQHNWMKCCCLDGIGTSIVSHQSPLQMTLLCQMTFCLWKEKEEKRLGFEERVELSKF